MTCDRRWGVSSRVAALFVETGGVYFDAPDVIDPWDATRDARTYAGPYPVVAHPPCERWGRYWGGGPMLAGTPRQKKLGDDGGCFESALVAVRLYGGVLEHPEGSHAWRTYGLLAPPKSGGWIPAGDCVGWTCCVEQGHYGHRARKATWLYVAGMQRHMLPELVWGPATGKTRMDDGFRSTTARRAARDAGRIACERLSKHERVATPVPFRDVLIQIARACRSPMEIA